MKPIFYEAALPVRFSDLDPYGHVNSTHYLDYVISARWAFARDNLKVTERSLSEKKVGFYLAKAQMAFKRPIAGGTIVARSHVQEIAEAKLFVPFEIRSADGATLHSDGVLEFLVIDLTTNKPISCPDWVRGLFFEEA
jgi:YbgC/YbaW family acyl-CoA thioester hydrolase